VILANGIRAGSCDMKSSLAANSVLSSPAGRWEDWIDRALGAAPRRESNPGLPGFGYLRLWPTRQARSRLAGVGEGFRKPFDAPII
jgi:hypothetical protein